MLAPKALGKLLAKNTPFPRVGTEVKVGMFDVPTDRQGKVHTFPARLRLFLHQITTQAKNRGIQPATPEMYEVLDSAEEYAKTHYAEFRTYEELFEHYSITYKRYPEEGITVFERCGRTSAVNRTCELPFLIHFLVQRWRKLGMEMLDNVFVSPDSCLYDLCFNVAEARLLEEYD